jgi:hypothetical protein
MKCIAGLGHGNHIAINWECVYGNRFLIVVEDFDVVILRTFATNGRMSCLAGKNFGLMDVWGFNREWVRCNFPSDFHLQLHRPATALEQKILTRPDDCAAL